MAKLAINEIKDRAEKLGISMASLCEGITDPTVLQRWNKKNPKSVETYRTLTEKLDKLEKEKTNV